MKLPNTYTNKNETGCCAIPNTQDWDEQTVSFEGKKFVRMYTKNFLHIPLNMGKVMTRLQQLVSTAKAEMPAQQAMILSHDLSPWKAEHLYSVSKNVPGADNVELSGEFITKVFEGPFQDAKKWHASLLTLVKAKGMTAKEVYFFYTTCPKCAKHYGKNYAIGLAKVS